MYAEDAQGYSGNPGLTVSVWPTAVSWIKKGYLRKYIK